MNRFARTVFTAVPALATVALIAAIFASLSAQLWNARTDAPVAIDCATPAGPVYLKPHHWKWVGGAFQDRHATVIIPAPAVCVKEDAQ